MFLPRILSEFCGRKYKGTIYKDTLTILILSLFCVLLFHTPTNARPYYFSRVQKYIERQVRIEIQKKGFVCQGERICGLKIVPAIYQQRNYMPVWFHTDGLSPAAHTLVEAIRKASQDGLKPSDYHFANINRLLETMEKKGAADNDAMEKQLADFDLILTDAFLLLGSHLSTGRINPEDIHADLPLSPNAFDISTFLNATKTQDQMYQVLDLLRPDHYGYHKLKVALHTMQQLAAQGGGWPRLPTKLRTLHPKQTDASMATIRRILTATGDLENDPPLLQPDLYDPTLVQAVRKFQSRHGLEPDGIIGRQTRSTMNVSVYHRIRQIELNLERWRWLPRQLGNRYIFVNTAAFFLKVMEEGNKKLDMKVVVGRPARQSPVFSSTMTYMVLNPYWNVPNKIAVEDILPKLADSVDYLINQSFKVFADWSENAQELMPENINWTQFNKHYFPLRFRQEPGEKNALGQIKFMFPNKYAVYLHDTPQKSLFTKFKRGFSSGCIRVEKAHALAVYLLSGSPVWTEQILAKNIEKGQRRVVILPAPITIHILYMTAWVDENGILQFREDIYQRDKKLHNALIKRNPYPLPPSIKEIKKQPSTTLPPAINISDTQR